MATSTPEIRPVTAATLRRLAELEPDGPILSAFIDLDPQRFATPPARESQLNSLLHSVAQQLDEKDPGGDERRIVEGEIELLRAYASSDDFPPSGATAAAVFVGGDDLFEVYPLRRSVEPTAVLSDRPMFEEIIEDAETQRWIVVLANRQVARLFVGPPDMLRERGEIVDEIHGKHDQGGWSQARYQRSIEEDVADHLQRAAKAIEELDRRSPAAGIIAGMASELWPTLEDLLPKPIRDRVVDRFDVDVELAKPDEIQERIEPIVARERARLEGELTGELEARIGRGERVAVGLEDVRKALFDKRVERVLHDEGFEVPADVVASALEQAATVTSISGDALDRHGRIAALLRF